MKKIALVTAVLILCCVLSLGLVACGDDGGNPSGGEEPKTVTVTINGDGGCFSRFKFTLDKGGIIDKAYYENITRINNGGKKVYFIGGWKDDKGNDFDFSKPIENDVTISPEITELYDEVDNYPRITIAANTDLKDNADMKTVVLPYKSPFNGYSFGGTVTGGNSYGSVFNGFDYIETAVFPEQIHTVSGSVFLNCKGLKEVYFAGYGYYMLQTVSYDFLDGCDALEHIYLQDDEALADFKEMLADAVADATEDGLPTENLLRFENMLSVKVAPDMTWEADKAFHGNE